MIEKNFKKYTEPCVNRFTVKDSSDPKLSDS